MNYCRITLFFSTVRKLHKRYEVMVVIAQQSIGLWPKREWNKCYNLCAIPFLCLEAHYGFLNRAENPKHSTAVALGARDETDFRLDRLKVWEIQKLQARNPERKELCNQSINQSMSINEIIIITLEICLRLPLNLCRV